MSKDTLEDKIKDLRNHKEVTYRVRSSVTGKYVTVASKKPINPPAKDQLKVWRKIPAIDFPEDNEK